MKLEQAVAKHYAHGPVEETILNVLAAFSAARRQLDRFRDKQNSRKSGFYARYYFREGDNDVAALTRRWVVFGLLAATRRTVPQRSCAASNFQ